MKNIPAILDKTITITGAAGGLGQALLDVSLRLGACKIYAALRKPERLAPSDRRIVPMDIDVTDPVSVQKAAALMQDADIIINNAGVARFGSLLDREISDLDLEMRTNYWGPVYMTKAMLPVFLKKGTGTIVNINSIAGLAALRYGTGYGASKAALHNFTQSVRALYAPQGIKVLGVYPGPFDTAMAAGSNLPKAKPLAVAEAILEKLDSGADYIFPDETSQKLGPIYMAHPLELEKILAEF